MTPFIVHDVSLTLNRHLMCLWLVTLTTSTTLQALSARKTRLLVSQLLLLWTWAAGPTRALVCDERTISNNAASDAKQLA
jgi:hypothetical protein